MGKLSLFSINPLHPYIIRGKEGVVELIRNAHPIWLKSLFWGKTLMHHSVEAHNIECVRALLERGVNINELDGSNKTPLHITAIHDYPEIAKLLIDSGASVNTSVLYKVKEFEKLTPLYFAKIYGSDKVEKLLIAKGAI
jgi:ankyrin repeat protein